MKKLKITVSGADIHAVQLGAVTTGMVGAVAVFAFDQAWTGLTKTAVFRAGNVTRDVVLLEEPAVTIPSEVLALRTTLWVGVYGCDADGTVVIPTVMTAACRIEAGTDPSGDPGTDPDLPVWAQLAVRVDRIVYILADGETVADAPAEAEVVIDPKGEGDEDSDIAAAVAAYLAENPITVTEKDPTVPDWAKQPRKPTYTATEVGALPDTTEIPTVPTNVSAFVNDAVYLTEKDLADYAKSEALDDKLDSDGIVTGAAKVDDAYYLETRDGDVRLLTTEDDTYINGLIDDKLEQIPNAAEVAY